MIALDPPSDALVASLCADVYHPAAPISFDHFDAGIDDGVCFALKKLCQCDVVIFRGSVTLQDWLRDFTAIAVPTRIGHVHEGFFEGMEKAWAELRPLLTQDVFVAGHSLGAARAAVMTGLMLRDGLNPKRRVVFGEPKPGLIDLAKLIQAVPSASYRNGDALNHDLVTDLPFSFPPLEYMHPSAIVPVTCKPTDEEFRSHGVFAWHSVALYETALHVLFDNKDKPS